MNRLLFAVLLLIGFSLPAQSYRHFIWRGPSSDGLTARSADSLHSALLARGDSVRISTDLFAFGNNLQQFDVIFAVLGVTPGNHILFQNDPEPAALQDYLAQGGSLYVEGGDCFGTDLLLGAFDINRWFGMNRARSGNFTPDLTGVIGVGLFNDLAFSYSGPGQSLDDLAPGEGYPIWRSNLSSDTSGVFYRGFGGGTGRALATVTGFGYLGSGQASRDTLMSRYLRLLLREDQAAIGLSAESLADTLQTGDLVTRVLRIENSGGLFARNLQFTISESPDVPWLVPGTDSGSVRFNSFQDVLYALNATQLGTGSYSTSLRINSNDPLRPLVVLPLQFEVVAPTGISLSPLALNRQLASGSSVADTVIISNTGQSDLIFSAGVTGSKNPALLNAVQQARRHPHAPYQTGRFAASIGKAPLATASRPAAPAAYGPLGRLSAHSYEQAFLYSYRTSFSLDRPEILPNVGPDPRPFEFDNAGSFPAGLDQSYYYLLDNGNTFSRMDTLTGQETIIGNPVPINSIYRWTAMTVNPLSGTLYAAASTGNESALFRLNPLAGSATPIGDIGYTGIIGLAMDGSGTLYAYDVVSDLFMSLDTLTGLGEAIGSIGFDANFGQGMSWDAASDEIYMAAFNNASLRAELRIIDRGTGLASLLGPLGIPEFTQLGFLALRSSIPAREWLSVTPREGRLAPGETQSLVVRFDAAGLNAGGYAANLQIKSNDLTAPVTFVSTELLVSGNPAVRLQSDSLSFGQVFSGYHRSCFIELYNSGSAALEITGINPGNNQLSFTGDTDSPVSPGARRRLEVRWTPAQAGSLQVVTEIFTNASPTPLTLPVSGFAIAPPVAQFSENMLDLRIAPGDSQDVEITLFNAAATGAAGLRWRLLMRPDSIAPYLPPPALFGTPLPADSGTSQPALGKAEGLRNATAAIPAVPYYLKRVAQLAGHSIEQVIGYRTRFDLAVPGVVPNLGPDPGSGFDNAGDFPVNDQSHYYLLDWSNTLSRIDTLTGNAQVLGSVVPQDNVQSWAAMATDPTTGQIYVASSSLQYSDLYLLDVDSVKVSFIANLFRLPNLIAMAFDDSGQLYGYNIGNDRLFRIDKESGATVDIGYLGYDSNFGQGMDWDANNGQMYLSAFNASFFDPELRIANLQTGQTVSLGILGQTVPNVNYIQLAFLGIPDRRFSFLRFREADKGTTAAGGSQRLLLRAYAGGDIGSVRQARIKLLSNDPATPELFLPVRVETAVISGTGSGNNPPDAFRLFANYPNPFNPATTIRFELPERGLVSLTVYNMLGQPVNELLSEANLPAGDYRFHWKGTDGQGRSSASGVYFVQLDVEGNSRRFRAVRKMLLLR